MQETMTTLEVAELLGVSTRTVQSYVKDGKLSAYRIGGTYRVTVESVNRLINNSFIKGENEHESE